MYMTIIHLDKVVLILVFLGVFQWMITHRSISMVLPLVNIGIFPNMHHGNKEANLSLILIGLILRQRV